MGGVLYVVATPIGNLGDITLRAIDILSKVDFVVAEHRERALKLLNHLHISKTIVTINSYNEERKAATIARHIAAGKSCALISGAGTPCISDPGGWVVRACHEAGVEVKAVPGPCAAAAAISVSGLYTDRFLFYGFLPKKQGKKKKILESLSILPYPVIFFESPRKLVETLGCVRETMEDRTVVVLKEMTKIYEQIMRGTIDEIFPKISNADGEPRGEYLIIVDGAENEG